MMAAARTRRQSLTALVPELPKAADRLVAGVSLDSRQLHAGDVFVALAGARVDGRIFVDDAIARGAAAVLVDAPAGQAVRAHCDGHVPVIEIPALRARAGEIAAAFYGRPTETVRVLGVTGTNGKTSCTHFLAQVLGALGHRTGLCGTLGNGFVNALTPTGLTTADPVTLQASLAELRDASADYVAMEVSSHALAQARVSGVNFEGALFTNLSRDHLDYHPDMRAYGETKRRLFLEPGLAAAALNLDDPWGRYLQTSCAPSVAALGYGVDTAEAQIHASRVRYTQSGLQARLRSPWGEASLNAPLLGAFSLANVMGVVTLLCGLGFPFERVVAACATLEPVPGRMEHFEHPDGFSIVVDYAHTPDALEKVLAVLRAHFPGTLTCIFGCGGDRDRGKRPEMGRVAGTLADRVVLCDDNPRGEEGDRIVADIRTGLPRGADARTQRDRIRAIWDSCREAWPGDAVLIAGKGHEAYQEYAHGRVPYSDIANVARLITTARREQEGPPCCSG